MSYVNLEVKHYESLRRLLAQNGYPTLAPFVQYDQTFDLALKDFMLRTFGAQLHSFPVRMAELPKAFVAAFGGDEGCSQFVSVMQDNPTEHLFDLHDQLKGLFEEVAAEVNDTESAKDPAVEVVNDGVIDPPADTPASEEGVEQPEDAPDEGDDAHGEEPSAETDQPANQPAEEAPVVKDEKPVTKVKLRTKK